MSWVLVVEDEDYIRTLVEVMLRKVGYDVVLAGSGKEAVELCQEKASPLG
jgi:CheY-like chemotaxis protein